MDGDQTRLHRVIGAHLVGAGAAAVVGFPLIAVTTWLLLRADQAGKLDAEPDALAALLPPALLMWSLIEAAALAAIAGAAGAIASGVKLAHRHTAVLRAAIVVVAALVAAAVVYSTRDGLPLIAAGRLATFMLLAVVYEIAARLAYRVMATGVEPTALDDEWDQD